MSDLERVAQLRVFTDSVDTIIAWDVHDALELYKDHYGTEYDGDTEELVEWHKPLTLLVDCSSGRITVGLEGDDYSTPVELSSLQMRALFGRGWLCSTEA